MGIFGVFCIRLRCLLSGCSECSVLTGRWRFLTIISYTPSRAEARESAPRFRVQIYRRAPDYAGGRRRTDRYPAVDRPFRRLIAAEVAGGCLEPCTKKNPASAGFFFADCGTHSIRANCRKYVVFTSPIFTVVFISCPTYSPPRNTR